MSTDPTPTVTVELTIVGTDATRAAADVTRLFGSNLYNGDLTAISVSADDGTPPPEPDVEAITAAFERALRRASGSGDADDAPLSVGFRFAVADLLARGVIAPGWRA